jgi:hypothetical protein
MGVRAEARTYPIVEAMDDEEQLFGSIEFTICWAATMPHPVRSHYNNGVTTAISNGMLPRFWGFRMA